MTSNVTKNRIVNEGRRKNYKLQF